MTRPEDFVDTSQTAAPGEAVFELRPQRDRLAGMSDDHKLEIAGHYANYQIPVDRIVSAYGVGNGDVTRIADELGIPRRDRRNVGKKLPPGRFVEGKWVVEPEPETPTTPLPEPDIPEDTRLALEQMFNEAERTAPVLPTAPEPVLRRTSQPALQVDGNYEVQVVGTINIHATSMLEALQRMAQDHPELHVQQIRELWPGHTS